MDIFQYLSPYLVMHAYYEMRKKYEKNFSYAVWAEELELKSYSTLRMMVNNKKKISTKVAEKFVTQNLTQPEERNYFRLLMMYEHSPTTSAKNAAWKSLSQILISRVQQKEDFDYLTYISNPLLPKLQTMLSFSDYDWNEQNLSASLSSTPQEIQEALKSLEKIGLAKRSNKTETPSWETTEHLLKVSDKLGNVAMKAYHNACLEEAKKAQDLPLEDRRYRSLLLPLNETELQSMQTEINTFMKQLISTYQAKEFKNRKLFKLNLNYHSVAKIPSEVETEK